MDSRCLLAACSVAGAFLLMSWQASAEDATVQKFGDWTVTIQPGPRGSGIRDVAAKAVATQSKIQLASQQTEDNADVPAPPKPRASSVVVTAGQGAHSTACVDCPTIQPARDPLALVGQYSDVYDRIPFSRAEYEATPSYRHDATMEFLFGQMRPTVINRGTTVIRHSQPAMPVMYPPAYSPYGFNSYYFPFSQGYGYHGYLQPYSLW